MKKAFLVALTAGLVVGMTGMMFGVNTNPTPEPGSLALLVSGLAGGFGYLRLRANR